MVSKPNKHELTTSQHYRTLALKSRVESAGPHGLVALLYDELLAAIDLLVTRSGQQAKLAGSAPLTRAQSIIVALEASLDFDKGGELAAVLARIYRSARNNLAAAVMEDDGEKLQEIRDAVSNIAYAWQALAD
jgi:flagellar secretion chaperone FliS